MQKLLLSLVLLYLSPAGLRAQEKVMVSGIITDSLTQPVAGAVVSLKNQKLVRTGLSDSKGFYSVAVPANESKFTLHVTHVSFNDYADSLTVGSFFGTITKTVVLSPKAKSMTGITVTAAAPYITQTAEKITINAAASPVAAGGNAYDVLLSAPGVMEINNNLQFRGKGISILIDGRQTNLQGDELKNFLTTMPANGIDKVELLPNPSSKYDAQGGSVINIKLAKNKNFGTNGSLMAGVGAGRYGRYNAGVSLNNRNKKTNVYGSYDYQYNRQYYKNASVRVINPDKNITENEFDLRERNNHAFKLGLDYDISKRTSFGFLMRGFANYRNRSVDNRSVIDVLREKNDTTSAVSTFGKASFSSPALNVYLKSVLDSSGNELTVNADYFSYHKAWSDDFVTRYYDPQGVEYLPAYVLRDNSPGTNDVYSASADFLHPGKKIKWEAGLKTTFTQTDNDVRWEYLQGGSWKTDAGKTNRFIYKENINAAYININKAFKKSSVQAGLRLEQTNAQAISVTLNTTNKRNYANLFPVIAYQYQLKKNQQLSFTYRKSIQRFGFEIVNPFVIYQSQYAYYQGNPSIKPMILHTVGASHSWKYQLFSNVTYTYIKDALAPVYRQNMLTNTVINSYDNLNMAHVLNVDITLAKAFLKGKWISSNTAGSMYAKYVAKDGSLQSQNARLTGFFTTSNQFKLKRDWMAELSAFYYSPIASGVYQQKNRFSVNTGLSKELWKKKANLKLSVRDIFNTLTVRYDIKNAGINAQYENKMESRFVNLAFTWKFGNMNVKANKNRRTGVEEERGRMGAN